MKKKKLPKRIQEIINNQGKIIIRVDEDIEKARIEIAKENKEADEELRRILV